MQYGLNMFRATLYILLQKKFITDNQNQNSAVKGFLQLTEIEPFLRSNLSTTFFLHLSMGGKQKKTKFVADNVKVTLKT